MDYQVGIDIGSTAAKAVVMKQGEIVKKFHMPTGYSSVETANVIYEKLNQDNINIENAYYIATGYGRISVPYANHVVTEITCHGKGAYWLFGQDGTVIDIGGQDTKVIVVKNGRVINFVMNDKCSAGTGKFIEVMANRLGVTQEELSLLAAQGTSVAISSMCTVFAESEVISLIGKGTPREDIAKGIYESVIQKVTALMGQIGGAPYFLTGGLCQNEYFLKCLGEALKSPVLSHEDARFAGAIGAALHQSE